MRGSKAKKIRRGILVNLQPGYITTHTGQIISPKRMTYQAAKRSSKGESR